MKKFNLNSSVKVRLTAQGFKVLEDQHNELMKEYPYDHPAKQWRPPRVDVDGYCTFQMWVFMEHFGEHTHIGMNDCGYSPEILIDERDLKDE